MYQAIPMCSSPSWQIGYKCSWRSWHMGIHVVQIACSLNLWTPALSIERLWLHTLQLTLQLTKSPIKKFLCLLCPICVGGMSKPGAVQWPISISLCDRPDNPSCGGKISACKWNYIQVSHIFIIFSILSESSVISKQWPLSSQNLHFMQSLFTSPQPTIQFLNIFETIPSYSHSL